MKQISTQGWAFLAYGLAVCGYFSSAVVNRWPAPEFPVDNGSYSSGSYSSGSSYGRSSGGSWGGGK